MIVLKLSTCFRLSLGCIVYLGAKFNWFVWKRCFCHLWYCICFLYHLPLVVCQKSTIPVETEVQWYLSLSVLFWHMFLQVYLHIEVSSETFHFFTCVLLTNKFDFYNYDHRAKLSTLWLMGLSLACGLITDYSPWLLLWVFPIHDAWLRCIVTLLCLHWRTYVLQRAFNWPSNLFSENIYAWASTRLSYTFLFFCGQFLADKC